MVSIKYKFPLILIAVIVLFSMASAWISNLIIMPPFQEMDEQRINKNMQRNINALLDNIEDIERVTKDWGVWDDAYSFMQNHNQNFIKSNINRDAFKTIKVDVIIYLNLDNKVVWGGYLDPDFPVVSSVQQEESRIIFGKLSVDLAKIRRAAGLTSGLYLFNNQLVMFAISPVLDTNAVKPAIGSVMMLRLVTTAMIEELEARTESSFYLVPINGIDPTEQQQKLIQQLTTSSQSLLLEQGEDLLAHNVIPTVDGGHLLMSVREKKSLATTAKVLINQVIIWLVVGGVIIFLLSFYLIQHYVVSPVLEISHHVREINKTKDYSLRLSNHIDDEIGELSDCIDGFVDTISSNLLQLEKLNEAQKAELDYRKDLEFSLQKANEQLKRLASLDGLTGLANRRIFDEKFSSEWRRMLRHQRYLTLILLDIDFFKKYNDCYGHTKGDECLIEVARALRILFKRSEDLVARYGGEEFAIVLPECCPEIANQLGEDVVRAIAGLYIAHKNSDIGVVSCSVGVCSVLPNELIDCEDLLRLADENLYKAKATGRNQSWFTVMRDIDVRADGLLRRPDRFGDPDNLKYT